MEVNLVFSELPILSEWVNPNSYSANIFCQSYLFIWFK